MSGAFGFRANKDAIKTRESRGSTWGPARLRVMLSWVAM